MNRSTCTFAGSDQNTMRNRAIKSHASSELGRRASHQLDDLG